MDWLAQLYCQSNLYIEHNPLSRRLRIARLLVRGETLIGLQPYVKPDIAAYLERNWAPELRTWLEDFPQRSDLAVPFLTWTMLNGREPQSQEISEMIYAHNPEDPVGLWFTGLSLSADPRTAQKGLNRMRLALKHDIERFLPVQKEIKDQLLKVQRNP